MDSSIRSRKYYQENKERVLERQKEYNQKHRKERKEYARRHYRENKERIKEANSEYSKSERGKKVRSKASSKYYRSEKGREATNRRNGTKQGKLIRSQAALNYYYRVKEDPAKYKEHLLKCRAQNALRYALKVGKIKKDVCEVCGEFKVDAHHDDYSFPLKVRWLCRLCHRRYEIYKKEVVA